MDYGGDTMLHARAQDRAWAHMQKYWREKLGAPCVMESFEKAFERSKL